MGNELGALPNDKCALLRRRHVGFAFQPFHVPPHLDVAPNVRQQLLCLQETAAPMAKRVEAALIRRLADWLAGVSATERWPIASRSDCARTARPSAGRSANQ